MLEFPVEEHPQVKAEVGVAVLKGKTWQDRRIYFLGKWVTRPDATLASISLSIPLYI